MSDPVDDYLAHYGVKGMRWGHRKSEEEVQAHRMAKAEKFLVKAAVLETRISELSLHANEHTYGVNNRIAELRKQQNQHLADAEAKRQGKMTSTQKKVVVGASIVAALAATYIAQDTLQSGEATRLISKGRQLFTGETFEFKKDPKLANLAHEDEILDKVVRKVNPDYGAMGTKMNCRRATFSYEMRRRGYDVQATKTTNANGQNVHGLMNATTPGKFKSTKNYAVVNQLVVERQDFLRGKSAPTFELVNNFAAGGRNKIPGGNHPDSIFQRLSKEPDGSRGELGVMWAMGGGHSMAYEIFNGKPVIFDAQSGQKLDTPEKFAKSMGKLDSSGFTRLDNVELNHDYLMRWMKNAK